MAITAAAFLPAASELPFLPAAACEALAPLVVLAPHPDDESLACGGLIALLRGRGLPVHVMAVSDVESCPCVAMCNRSRECSYFDSSGLYRKRKAEKVDDDDVYGGMGKVR